LDYIEYLLHYQLQSAVGKIVQPYDMLSYAKWHMNQLYRDEYKPKPFSYAVRRSGYYPEGTVSIESVSRDEPGVNIPQPITTVVRHTTTTANDKELMKFALDASTTIKFRGDQYVHGWVNQQFAGHSNQIVELVCVCSLRCVALRCVALRCVASSCLCGHIRLTYVSAPCNVMLRLHVRVSSVVLY
jgi:hypothetical protein